MIDLSTVKELRALRLPGMARELESQLEEPQRYKALSFEDRLALLVDAENVSRRKNTIHRRIHEVRLSESQACVEAIEYYEDRKLDKGLITKLATCAYIRDNRNTSVCVKEERVNLKGSKRQTDRSSGYFSEISEKRGACRMRNFIPRATAP